MKQQLARGLVTAAVALAGLATTPAPAQQQQADGEDVEVETFQDWTVRCPEDGDERCQMTQIVNHPDNGKPMLRVVMGYPPQIDSAAMIFLLPLGTRLAPGVQLVVDDSEPRDFPFQICVRQGCQADLKLEDPLRQRMRAGSVATLSVIGPSGSRVDLNISLQGFTGADDRIRP